MRVASSPVYYKDEICWPVARPDDLSMSHQMVGLHFFNGPSPIPLKGYGRATSDVPAPALVDITLQRRNDPYGNTTGSVSGAQSVADVNIGWLMAYASGSWALHPADDIIEFGFVSWLGVDTGLPGGQVTVKFTQMPYTVMGRKPVMPSGKTAGPSDAPEIEFLYSNQVWMVGRGAIGFGSEGVTA
jgi:hypothetical protein